MDLGFRSILMQSAHTTLYPLSTIIVFKHFPNPSVIPGVLQSRPREVSIEPTYMNSFAVSKESNEPYRGQSEAALGSAFRARVLSFGLRV